jgi:hypothetical protein
LLDGVGLVGGDQEYVAGAQVCLLAVHDEQDFSRRHVADLLVRVRVGRVWFGLGAVVEIHDDYHEVVGVRQATFCAWADLLCGHFVIF